MNQRREVTAEARPVAEGHAMRKWLVTMAVLGAGGVGAFLLTDKGRDTVRRWLAHFQGAPEHWNEWNESAQEEMEHIRAALNQIAQSLDPHEELGR